MSELFDKAVETIRALPPDEHDEIARAMLALADADSERIGEAHSPSVLEGLAQARRGSSRGRLK